MRKTIENVLAIYALLDKIHLGRFTIMLVCLALAAFVAFFSIFAFFGDAFSNTGGVVIPNMFHLMFGGTSTYQDVAIVWKQYGGLTFLFVLQIVMMICAILLVVLASRTDADSDALMGFSVVFALMSLVALIVSFNTLGITNINQGGRYNVKLGFGPVFYSVLHIIVVVLIVIGIIIRGTEPSSATRTQTYSKPSSASRGSVHYLSVETKPSLSQEEASKKIRVEQNLLSKGVITQEEYRKRVAAIKASASSKRVVDTGQPEDNTAQKIRVEQTLLSKGIITQEEYQKRVAAIKAGLPVEPISEKPAESVEEQPKEPVAEQPKKPDSQKQKEPVAERPKKSDHTNIELLREYHQLLEEGVITQEEYDKKKSELLNKD